MTHLSSRDPYVCVKENKLECVCTHTEVLSISVRGIFAVKMPHLSSRWPILRGVPMCVKLTCWVCVLILNCWAYRLGGPLLSGCPILHQFLKRTHLLSSDPCVRENKLIECACTHIEPLSIKIGGIFAIRISSSGPYVRDNKLVECVCTHTEPLSI